MTNKLDAFDPFGMPRPSLSDFDPFAAAPTQAAPAPAPLARPTGFGDALERGFKRALPETKSLLYGAGAAAAGLVGADGLRDAALERYHQVQQDEVAPLQNEASFMGVLKGDDSAAEWAGDVLGNFGGQALQSVVAAGAGAAVGSVAPGAGTVGGAATGLLARPVLKRAVGEHVAKLVAEGAAKDAVGKAVLKRAGMVAAPLALNIGQEAGIAYTGRAEDAAAAGEALTPRDAARALAWGVPAGLVDTVAEGLAAGRLLKGASQSGSMARRMAVGAAKGGITEGATEGVQAVMERAGADRALTGQEAYTDYIENVAAGTLGGGVMGGGSGVRRPRLSNEDAPADANAEADAPPTGPTPTSPPRRPTPQTPFPQAEHRGPVTLDGTATRVETPFPGAAPGSMADAANRLPVPFGPAPAAPEPPAEVFDAEQIVPGAATGAVPGGGDARPPVAGADQAGPTVATDLGDSEVTQADAAAAPGGVPDGTLADAAAGAQAQGVSPVQAAAAEAATSPDNDLREPSEKEREVGNFKVGRLKVHGLDVSVEYPAGVKRKAEHEQPLAHAYGRIRRTEGADGEHVDVFMGDNATDESLPVFVIDQRKADGSFDEHKVMLGFTSPAEARAAYRANFPANWNGDGHITRMEPKEFAAWVRDTKATRQPVSDFDSHARQLNSEGPLEDFGPADDLREALVSKGARDTRPGALLPDYLDAIPDREVHHHALPKALSGTATLIDGAQWLYTGKVMGGAARGRYEVKRGSKTRLVDYPHAARDYRALRELTHPPTAAPVPPTQETPLEQVLPAGQQAQPEAVPAQATPAAAETAAPAGAAGEVDETIAALQAQYDATPEKQKKKRSDIGWQIVAARNRLDYANTPLKQRGAAMADELVKHPDQLGYYFDHKISPATTPDYAHVIPMTEAEAAAFAARLHELGWRPGPKRDPHVYAPGLRGKYVIYKDPAGQTQVGLSWQGLPVVRTKKESGEKYYVFPQDMRNPGILVGRVQAVHFDHPDSGGTFMDAEEAEAAFGPPEGPAAAPTEPREAAEKRADKKPDEGAVAAKREQAIRDFIAGNGPIVVDATTKPETLQGRGKQMKLASEAEWAIAKDELVKQERARIAESPARAGVAEGFIRVTDADGTPRIVRESDWYGNAPTLPVFGLDGAPAMIQRGKDKQKSQITMARKGARDFARSKPKSTAPEHVEVETEILGATDADIAKIGKAFNEYRNSKTVRGVTHVFDDPLPGEIVNLKHKAEVTEHNEVINGKRVRVYRREKGWMTLKEAKAEIDQWKAAAQAQGGSASVSNGNSQRVVLSLFDLTGEWSRPWEEAGYTVYRFDIQDDWTFEYEDPETGEVETRKAGDIHNLDYEFFVDMFGMFEDSDVYAILAANPCTDFTNSGAKHFAAKDADGRTVSSVRLVQRTLSLIDYFKPPVWALENPTGRIGRINGLPPARLVDFHPFMVGDDYTKDTKLWGRFNADLPIAPVNPNKHEGGQGSKMHSRYGGKSIKTKNARSETPEGFAYAFFAANNAVDNPLLAVAGEFDRLDRAKIKAALDKGVTPKQIKEAVDDLYYMELDDEGGNRALDYLAEHGWPDKKAAPDFVGSDGYLHHTFWEQFSSDSERAARALGARRKLAEKRAAPKAKKAKAKKANKGPVEGRLFQRGSGRSNSSVQAVQLPGKGGWWVRTHKAGQWQPWEHRKTFDAAPMFGYHETGNVGGGVTIPGFGRVTVQKIDKPQRKTEFNPLLDLIAGAGGISREDAARFGVDPREMNRRRGIMVLFSDKGMPLDALREVMIEEGYFPAEPDDRPSEIDLNMVWELVDKALSGTPVGALDDPAMLDYMMQREAERWESGADEELAPGEERLAAELYDAAHEALVAGVPEPLVLPTDSETEAAYADRIRGLTKETGRGATESENAQGDRQRRDREREGREAQPVRGEDGDGAGFALEPEPEGAAPEAQGQVTGPDGFALETQQKSQEVEDDEARRTVQSKQTGLFGASETRRAADDQRASKARNAPPPSAGGGLFAGNRQAPDDDAIPPADSDDTIPFKQGQRRGGLTKAAVEAIIAKLRAGNADVRAVQSAKDLPAEVLADARKRGIPLADLKGVHYKGVSYLVAENLTAAEVAATLFHEAFTHGGLRLRYGNKVAARMNELARRLPGTGSAWDRVVALAEAQGIDLGAYVRDLKQDASKSEDAKLAELAEELLAHMSETSGSLRAFLEEVLGLIRDFLRRHGFALAEASVADLRYELRRARQAVQDQAALAKLAPNPAPAYQRGDSADWYYSALAEAIGEGKGAPKKADATAWKQWLDGAQRRGAIKKAERDWLGVDAWLDTQGTVTRQALADYVRAHAVKVEDRVLGRTEVPATSRAEWDRLTTKIQIARDLIADAERRGDAGAERTAGLRAKEQELTDQREALFVSDGVAQYGAHTLPGGENYTELLLTLRPPEPDFSVDDFIDDMVLKYGSAAIYDSNDEFERTIKREFPAMLSAEDQARYEAIARARRPDAPEFNAGHFDASNVLVHVRYNERTDADGKRVLFLEEIQSDWHQQGRKRGYILAETTGWTATERDKGSGAYIVRDANGDRLGLYVAGSSHEAIQRAHAHRFGDRGARVANAPFKGTDEWAMLAFKRMVRWAAENGFDRIAWTTGEQQADRYNLSHHVEAIYYQSNQDGRTYTVSVDAKGSNSVVWEDFNATPERIAEVLGKEVADKIVAKQGDKAWGELDPSGTGIRVVRGLDLKVGGGGLRGFYDKIVPAAVNKWAKPFGGRVGEALVKTGEPNPYPLRVASDGLSYWVAGEDPRGNIGNESVLSRKFDSSIEAMRERDNLKGGLQAQHTLDLTDSMRTAAMRGLPLFRRGDQLGSDAFKAWFGKSKVVNADGSPKPVYHGTAAEFWAFEKRRLAESTGHMTAPLGFFFAEDKAKAQRYAEKAADGVPADERVVDVYLAITNPKRMTVDELMEVESQDEARALRAKLERAGHDGIHLADIGQWVAFEPTQIKSASENTGDFDGANPDIRYSRRAPADVVADIEEVMATATGRDRTLIERVKAWFADFVASPAKAIGDLKDATRTTWLGALATSHLTELGSDYNGGFERFYSVLQALDAMRTELQQEGDEIAERMRKWASKHTDTARKLFKLAHDATIDGVDPAEAYAPLQFRYAGQLWEVNRKNVRAAIKALRQQMHGRSGETNPDLRARIHALNAMLKAEPGRKQKHPELVARWEELGKVGPRVFLVIGTNGRLASRHGTRAAADAAMTDGQSVREVSEAQSYYIEMRDTYAARSEMVEEGLVARIKATDATEAQKAKLISSIRLQFEGNRLQGVYFPLQRFGRYFVGAEKGDQYTFLMFDTPKELERGVAALKAKGFTILKSGLKGEGKAADAPSGTFVAEIITGLRKAGVADAALDEVYQTFLHSLPELSLRKHAIHRRAVPGFDPDAVRAFAFHMMHGAHQIARLNHAHRLSAVLTGLHEDQDRVRAHPDADPRRVAATDAILGELEKRFQWILNPTDSKWTNLLSSFGFVYYLGVTPAAALVNLTQTPLIAFPYLAARYKAGPASRALSRAMQDALATLGHSGKRLTDADERRAYATMEKMGVFQHTQTYNLAGIAAGGLAANPRWARAMELIGGPFQRAEVINREATALAAYRLARANRLSHETAINEAVRAVNDTHYDYTNQNRSRVFQMGSAKVLLMFKQYSLNTTWHIGRMAWQSFKDIDPNDPDAAMVKQIARRNLVGVMGMTSLFAGVLGLPMLSTTFAILNAIAASFGDDDEPWDAETEFRAFLADMLGSQAAAEFIATGPVNALGVDLHSRVSMGQLWWRDADRELDGRGAYLHLLEQAAGPIGGALKNTMVGKQMIDEGHVWRGVETMLPKALKDVMKAQRYAAQGVNNLRGDPLVEDLGPGGALLQLLGFTPAEVAQQYDTNRALKNYEKHIKDRRRFLMDGYAMSLRLGDEEGMREVQERIVAFNAKYPELAITTKGLRQSMRQRADYTAQAQDGIFLDRRIAARVRAEVGVDGGE